MINTVLSAFGLSSTPQASSAPKDVLITHELVRSWLTLDNLWRRNKHWPLLQGEQLAALLLQPTKVSFAEDVVHTYVGGPRRCVCPANNVLPTLFGKFCMLEQVLKAADGHLLIAGGAVVKVLFGLGSDGDDDVDMFFYGLQSEQEALDLLQHIFSSVFDEVLDIRVTISQHCVTVHHRDNTYFNNVRTRYQFILRLYDTPDQILGGFDLPCCAVGVSPHLNNHLIATPLAAFHLVTSTIFVDTSRRSTTYVSRLYKYNNRSFSVVFSLQKDVLMQQRQHDGTMWWNGTYRLYDGGRFQCQHSHDPKSDYDATDVPAIHYWANIVRAAENRVDEIVRSGRTLHEALQSPEMLGAIGLDMLYKHRVESENYRSTGLPILRMVKRWFGEDAVAFFEAKVNDDYEALERIKCRTIARISANFETAKHLPLKFITIDPGRQYTGSFNPIFEHPTKFYGTTQYRPLYIGIRPEIRSIVWQIGKHFKMPNDVIRYLCRFVAFACALHEVEKCGFAEWTRVESPKQEV